MSDDGPGWGHPHTHVYAEVARVGELIVEQCACGKKRHVIERQRETS